MAVKMPPKSKVKQNIVFPTCWKDCDKKGLISLSPQVWYLHWELKNLQPLQTIWQTITKFSIELLLLPFFSSKWFNSPRKNSLSTSPLSTGVLPIIVQQAMKPSAVSLGSAVGYFDSFCQTWEDKANNTIHSYLLAKNLQNFVSILSPTAFNLIFPTFYWRSATLKGLWPGCQCSFIKWRQDQQKVRFSLIGMDCNW